MKFDLNDLVSLPDACKLFPRVPSIPTIYRWVNKGTKGVKLQTVNCGRNRFTTAQWVRDFIEAQNATTPAPPTERTPEMQGRLRAAGLI